MNKPAFDPSKPFEAVKPAFDPSKPFESADPVSTAPMATATDDDASPIKSATTGLIQGSTAGFGDELGPAGDTAMAALSGRIGPLAGGSLDDLIDDYKNSRDRLRAEFARSQAANPKINMAGQLVGAIATGGTSSAGQGLGAAVKTGAAYGATAGLGNSDADLTTPSLSNYGQALKDTGKGAVIGAAGGAAGYGVGKAVSSVVNPAQFAPGLRDTAETAAASALGAERSSIKAAGGLDDAQSIGRYALDNGVVSPLASTDEMLSRNAALQKQGGQMMGDVYNKIDQAGASTFNPLDTASAIEDKIGGFYRSPINRGETNQLENTLESVLMRGDSNIPLSEAQSLKQELGKVANWKNSVSVSPKEQMARDAYGVVSKDIDSATQSGAESLNDPSLLDTLKQGKSLYSDSTNAQKFLDNKSAREAGNKMFGLSDYAVAGPAIAAAPFTAGHSLLAIPALGIKKGLEKFGQSTLAVGADKVADLVSQTPEVFGKWAPALQDAAQRGSQSLAVTHYLLQQNDPDFRKHVQSLYGDKQ